MQSLTRTIGPAIAATAIATLIASLPAVPKADEASATPSEVVAKVHEAAALLASKGPAALKVLRDPRSRFRWKDSYVFVVNCATDEVLANSAFPNRVGGDIKRHTDFGGVQYGLALCAAAKRPGGGWIEYTWLRPGGVQLRRKVSYVVTVKGLPYQVGAGIYDETISLKALGKLVATRR